MIRKTRFLYLIIFSLALSFQFVNTTAQKWEFTPFAGFQTAARIKSIQGDFHIDRGWDFGASINHEFGDQYRIELSYSRMSTNLSFSPDASTTQPVCKLALTYISLGGVVDILPDEAVIPFAKIALGGTLYKPIDSTVESVSVMHFDISGGVKFDLSEHFWLRLQASLLLPVFFEGIYFPEAMPNPGEGMSTEVSGIQGNFTGGLIYRF